MEITTAGYYVTPPAYAVAGFSVPTPTNGTILLSIGPGAFWRASPLNAKRSLVWSIVLVNASGYVIPVVSGKVAFLPNNTVLAP